VEIVIAKQIELGHGANVVETCELKQPAVEEGQVTYALDYTPNNTGTFDVAIRVFPKNPRLPHRMDFALVKWA
ncbi:MAG: hypothetical protein K2J33_01140, partial [Alistipes sp.]|nr:hypothetical protein [Alistipes sp.]